MLMLLNCTNEVPTGEINWGGQIKGLEFVN